MTTKFGKSAIVILVMVPIAANLTGWVGLDNGRFQYPVYGALLYFLFWFVTIWFCPATIKQYRTEENYKDFCRGSGASLNPYKEFADANALSPEDTLQYFSNQSLLYPLAKGLERSREECIDAYAAVTYRLANASRPWMRWLAYLILGASLFMMEYLLIRRLLHFLF